MLAGSVDAENAGARVYSKRASGRSGLGLGKAPRGLGKSRGPTKSGKSVPRRKSRRALGDITNQGGASGAAAPQKGAQKEQGPVKVKVRVQHAPASPAVDTPERLHGNSQLGAAYDGGIDSDLLRQAFTIDAAAFAKEASASPVAFCLDGWEDVNVDAHDLSALDGTLNVEVVTDADFL